MWTTQTQVLLAVALSCSLANSAAVPKKHKNTAYPFTKLVVFGDQFADDGNGSWAHGDDVNNLFGFYTWTDGPVAPTYLAGLLGIPSENYAFGGAAGNGLAGATLDNNYTEAIDYWNPDPNDPSIAALAPSTQQQIYDNYTAHGAPSDISTSLQMIWAGQNDMKKHTNWPAQLDQITPTNPFNVKFYGNYTYYLRTQAEYLIELGAPAVVVFNLLPYHTTPANEYLFCKGLPACSTRWGKVIETANNKLKAALAASQHADKIIYYDLYSFMMSVQNNKANYGYTEPLIDFCNGNSSELQWQWPMCAQKPLWTHARPFYWFTLSQPETSMHQYIAQDVQKTIDAFLAN